MVFGVARVGSVEEVEDKHRRAVFDRYLNLSESQQLSSIGGDPRLSTQHSISSMAESGVGNLLGLEGIAGLDDLPEIRPSPPDSRVRHVVAVYVGRSAEPNLATGLDKGVWGWKRHHLDYETVRPGDRIVFGVGYSGGSPRAQPEEFIQHRFGRVVSAEISSEVYEDSEPIWVDEIDGTTTYPHRINFAQHDTQTDVAVAELDMHIPGLAEAFRRSASTAGRGVIVTTETGLQPVQAGSLEDACADFAAKLHEAHLGFGSDHEDFARRFVVSLVTKRFLILTGFSGSGKTNGNATLCPRWRD